MIYSETPATTPANYKTMQKKHTTVISPEIILGNEKLMLTLMFTAMAAVLLTWSFRSNSKPLNL